MRDVSKLPFKVSLLFAFAQYRSRPDPPPLRFKGEGATDLLFGLEM